MSANPNVVNILMDEDYKEVESHMKEVKRIMNKFPQSSEMYEASIRASEMMMWLSNAIYMSRLNSKEEKIDHPIIV